MNDIGLFNSQNKYATKDQGRFFVFVEHGNAKFGRLMMTKYDLEDTTSAGVNRVKW